MTHAFFKALLFLGAGAVIHALDGEQEMPRMGGLRHKLPITWMAMLVAALAISGIPPLAGFFSKDQILEAAYASGNHGLWLLGLITAGLTSFYMFRLIFLTFHGESRLTPENDHRAHEAPPVMTLPLIVLAILAIVGGWVGLPRGILWGDALARWLDPVVGHPAIAVGAEAPGFALGVLASVVALTGIAVAAMFYLRLPGLPALLAYRARAFHALLMHKYYIDELYDVLISRPLFWLSATVFHRGVDVGVIDGIVDSTGLTVAGSGEELRRVETGNVQQYALVYLLGALAIAAYYVYRVIG
jgi:NADH-quinone oxidoreductase subunit L